MITQNLKVKSVENVHAEEKIRIAVCPTYHKMAKKIDQDKYEIVETQSTAQSLKLLEEGIVSMILAGRVLRASEPKAKSYIVCDTGYSFLDDDVKTIRTKDLEYLTLYTDLDIDVLKETFGARHIHKVNDVNEYLEKGIVITSWKNTDYDRAAIVHVMDSDHVRSSLSRRPTLYYLDSIDGVVEEVGCQLMVTS